MNVQEARAAAGQLTGSFPVRVVKRYLGAQGPNSAILIAWNGLFAMFPILLVTATVIGLVLHNPTIAGGIEQQVVHALPGKGDAQKQVTDALNAFKDKSGLLAIVGFVGLLWSGSALFGAIEQGLNALYPCKPRGFVAQKLLGFGMILLFTVLAVPLVLSSSLLPALESLPVVPRFLSSGPVGLLLQLAAGALDGAVLFAIIYYVVPHRRQRLRQVLPGALVAGVLIEALTMLFPLYFNLAGGFAAYGATFALFFLLLTWFYLLGQITMLGGAVVAEYEMSHPARGAQPSMDALGRRAVPAPAPSRRG
jgi:membrane protein